MKKDKPFLISSYNSSSIFRSLTNTSDAHISSCDPSGYYMEAQLIGDTFYFEERENLSKQRRKPTKHSTRGLEPRAHWYGRRVF